MGLFSRSFDDHLKIVDDLDDFLRVTFGSYYAQ